MTSLSDSPAYCVSLRRATERRRKMIEDWTQSFSFNFIFWDAVDRRRIADIEWYSPLVNRTMSGGEIACILSYLDLFWFLEQQGCFGVFIMEDDIAPLVNEKREIYEAVESTLKEFPAAQKILLHEISPANSALRPLIYADRCATSSLCSAAPYGNQFFYLTREGIAAERYALQSLLMPADHSQEFYFLPNKLLAIVNTPLARHEWFGPKAVTYIGNKFRNTRRRFVR